MARLLRALARDLEQRGRIQLDECFIDGSFGAEKRGLGCLLSTQR